MSTLLFASTLKVISNWLLTWDAVQGTDDEKTVQFVSELAEHDKLVTTEVPLLLKVTLFLFFN